MDAVPEWEAVPERDIPIGDIKTLPELQPRDLRLIKDTSKRLNQQDRLDEMISTLADLLKLDPNREATPILAVDTGQGLFITDGHHRFAAYCKARRETIPVRVLKKPLKWAIAVSRMVNTRGSTVALHEHEVIEAVWTTISILLEHGKAAWSKRQAEGFGYRSISTMFNGQVSIDSVGKMIRSLLVKRTRTLSD